MSDQVGVREGLPMGAVTFERYRLHSMIGQAGKGKMSTHRAVHIIEPLAGAQDGARPQGFAKTQGFSKSSGAACLQERVARCHHRQVEAQLSARVL
jgi:hypothetical protein